MEFNQFIQWAFYGFISFGAYTAVNTLGQLKDSVNELNEKLAVVLEKTAWHEKQIMDHGDRLKTVEEFHYATRNKN